MQEAWIVFDRCAKKYSGLVDNPAWFMALYQRALIGQFNDFSTISSRRRHVISESNLVNDDGELPTDLREPVGEVCNEGELRVLVRQAPSEVKMVLALLFNAPSELLEMISDAFQGARKSNSMGNKHLCLLLGVSEDTDLLGRVRDYFG